MTASSAEDQLQVKMHGHCKCKCCMCWKCRCKCCTCFHFTRFQLQVLWSAVQFICPRWDFRSLRNSWTNRQRQVQKGACTFLAHRGTGALFSPTHLPLLLDVFLQHSTWMAHCSGGAVAVNARDSPTLLRHAPCLAHPPKGLLPTLRASQPRACTPRVVCASRLGSPVPV